VTGHIQLPVPVDVEYASDPYRANTFRRALAALVTARSPGFTDLRALTALVAVTHSRAWYCTTVARFRQDHAGRPRLASLLSSTFRPPHRYAAAGRHYAVVPECLAEEPVQFIVLTFFRKIDCSSRAKRRYYSALRC